MPPLISARNMKNTNHEKWKKTSSSCILKTIYHNVSCLLSIGKIKLQSFEIS